MTGLSSSPQNAEQIYCFDRFYQQNYQWLYSWLNRTLRANKHSIEDIMQDTFLKIFIHADSGEKIKEPRPYLATIAKNIILNQIRRKKIEEDYLRLLAEQEEALDCSPEQIVTVLEILHRVADILARLPERQRLAMIMHYIEEMPQTAIASRFAVSRKTIQLDLAKALLFCHRQLKFMHS